MNNVFDTEFKLYLHNKGINVDNNIFDVKFNPPQNFASYRQAEMDTARVNTFSAMIAIPQISKRFALKRFLGLSAEEMADNEKLWKEENIDEDTELPANSELRSAGVTTGGMAGDMSALSGATSTPLPGEDQAAATGAAPETPPPAA
jgi:hypothetical protein